MHVSSIRSWIIGALLVTLATLAGCSAMRLVYNQGPDLAYWKLDGFVDFSDAQKPRARQAIKEWFGWHRATQLPDYAAFLVRVQAQVLQPVDAAQVCALYDEVATRLEQAAEHALPAAGDIARGLSVKQIQHLEQKYEKSNKTFASEHLQSTTQERRAAVVKRTVENAEALYGRLDREQRALIEQAVAASPQDADVWMAERRARQQDTVNTLRRLGAEHADAAQAQAALRVLVSEVRRSPRPAYRAYQQRFFDHSCRLAAQIHNATTPGQRQAAVKKLKGWEGDLRALSAEP